MDSNVRVRDALRIRQAADHDADAPQAMSAVTIPLKQVGNRTSAETLDRGNERRQLTTAARGAKAGMIRLTKRPGFEDR
jgi:hypothetical protein